MQEISPKSMPCSRVLGAPAHRADTIPHLPPMCVTRFIQPTFPSAVTVSGGDGVSGGHRGLLRSWAHLHRAKNWLHRREGDSVCMGWALANHWHESVVQSLCQKITANRRLDWQTKTSLLRPFCFYQWIHKCVIHEHGWAAPLRWAYSQAYCPPAETQQLMKRGIWWTQKATNPSAIQREQQTHQAKPNPASAQPAWWRQSVQWQGQCQSPASFHSQHCRAVKESGLSPGFLLEPGNS